MIAKFGLKDGANFARNPKSTKFAQFAWLYFAHFTTFRDQALQFYSF